MRQNWARTISLSTVLATAAGLVILYLTSFLGQNGESLGSNFIRFFTYFTVLSNILGTFGGVRNLQKPGFIAGPWGTSIAVYLTLTALVYFLLLRGTWNPTGWSLVADWLLHYIAPFLYLAAWALEGNRKKLDLSFLRTLFLFPATFLGLTLVVGGLGGSYPYEFLNPSAQGWVPVGIAIGIIGLGIGLFGLVLRWATGLFKP